MKQVTGKALIKVLRRHGWRLPRVHGSHHVLGRPDGVVRLSVPVHGNKPLKIGPARHLHKMAGISESDL